jgi:DNA (cytosine-5)-methyltransferase 1
MEPDEPAPTITTQFYNLGSGRFGHYDTSQDRALSLREGALLQTFPRDYQFFEELKQIGIAKTGKLIGNAVPPRLGEFIGERVFDFYNRSDRQARLIDF